MSRCVLSFQHVRHDVAGSSLVHLVGDVDVAEGRFEAAVLHQPLERLGREVRGVVGRERPPEVVEAVDVAGVGVLVPGCAREVDSSGLLDAS